VKGGVVDREKTRFPGLYKRGEVFQFRAWTAGKPVWVTVPGGDVGVLEAERYRSRFLARPELVHGVQARFGAYAAEWLEHKQLKPNSRGLYEIQLRKHLAPLNAKRLSEITTRDVRALILKKKDEGLSAAAIQNMLTTLSSVMSTAVADGIIDSNPVMKLERGARPTQRRAKKVILSKEQMQSIVNDPTQWGVFASLALLSGLRKSEALGLRWEDILWDEGLIVVCRQLGRDGMPATLKGPDDESRSRVVEMPQALAHVLRTHQVRSRAVGGWVIRKADGRPMCHRNAQRGFVALKRRLGLPEQLTFHQLRHNYSTLLIGLGEEIAKVSRQLGHSSVATTVAIYTSELNRHSGSSAAKLDEAVAT